MCDTFQKRADDFTISLASAVFKFLLNQTPIQATAQGDVKEKVGSREPTINIQ